MSASPLSRKISENRDIPSRRITINDASQLPSDYSTTPGGTIFSTTPGGTRLIYDRSFLLQMRNSPLARTPPKNLPRIPGVTSPSVVDKQKKVNGDVKEAHQATEEKLGTVPCIISHMLLTSIGT
ncbi:4E-binding protein THOR [Chamberlinius hualienensis]